MRVLTCNDLGFPICGLVSQAFNMCDALQALTGRRVEKYANENDDTNPIPPEILKKWIDDIPSI